MKVKYVLAGALVAMFVVPGTASQLAARNAAVSQPVSALPSPLGTDGLFDDPDTAPRLSIALPTRFVAFEVGTHPLQSFGS